jgi:nicotinate-nucleotide--dimethylbenzimidazole phosphoribosyltransferase
MNSTPSDPTGLLAATLRRIAPLDEAAIAAARDRQDRLTKPAGALGLLEDVSVQLAGLAGRCPPPLPEPAVVALFAADHGVHRHGVTPWPQEVTAQMVANFLAGGAAVNALAAQVGATVVVVDVGVAAEIPPSAGLLVRKVAAGTADLLSEPAMTRAQAVAEVEAGIAVANELVDGGNRILLTGDMGIANTTASAALIAACTGADPADVTGRGTGIDDAMLAHKVDVVRRALDRHRPDPADPIGLLAAVGGFEHAAVAGLVLGGAAARVPVLLDGVIAGSAALVAQLLHPVAVAACFAGHRSAEPGHAVALRRLGLRPLVDLNLRLGEGTGALLALPIVQCAARALAEMAMFDTAGVTDAT